jgi:hypothetical protein
LGISFLWLIHPNCTAARRYCLAKAASTIEKRSIFVPSWIRPRKRERPVSLLKGPVRQADSHTNICLREASLLILLPVGTLITEHPPGGRRRSPASGSHRTQSADFPHWARQKLIHSLAIACNSG